jgi:hypothetical protein
MFCTAGASAGVGTLLTVVASLSSSKLRLLWSAGAVVTLFYAVWAIVGVSVTTQFALGVEKAGRSPGQPGAVPSWAALGDGTIDAGSSAPRRMGARRRGTAGSPWSSVAVRAVFLS